jgi:2',3'-cyclic-nucleotide 2'-phosphodiesterase (5'-nucleotidase family)
MVSWAHAEESVVRIIYVNDFHGFAEPYQPLGEKEKLGGVAHLAGAVSRLRREQPSLLLAAGDMIQGHNWANFFKGASVVSLMNLMRFDALTVGNHEFDYGPKVLQQRIAQARFPFLGANVEGISGLKPYVIKKLKGVKVAILGVVTQDTPVTTHPRNVAGLKFRSPEETVAHYLPELRRQAQVVVVLAHLGHQAERRLAERVPGIDVIVGGHSHTKVLEPVAIGQTIVVQAWEHAKALGVLDLTLKDGKIVKFRGFLQEIRPAAGPGDPAVQKLVAAYARKLEARLSETIAETEVDLDGEQVRIQETNLGNLITDVMRQVTGADVALMNGGGIRTAILKGPVKVKDIYATLPFDNYLVAVRLTGRQIKEALEHGVSGVEERAGRFPQVSGLTFTYSRSAPPGARVREVLIAGQPLEPDREYVLATNDYLAVGGDGYRALGEAIQAGEGYTSQGGALTGKALVYSDPGRWLRDLVIDYLKAQKKVSPQVAGRIKELP